MSRLMSVTCLRRRGIRIGNYRNVDIESGVGELLVEEQNDAEMKRAVRTARVLNYDKKPKDQLVPLRDVTLLWLKDDKLVLSGIERVSDMKGPCEYAQTWLCEYLNPSQIDIHKVRGDWPHGLR